MSDSNLLQNLPGLRDYYPAEFNKILHILDTMRQVSISYGYNEYEGPSIEKQKLIEAKSGTELMKEIFKLKDRYDNSLLLRPEQTPTLARMLAKEQQRFKKPIRWFSIPRLFRDETPQKGRVREFFQLNVDILGEDSISADAEVISLAIDILRKLGFQNKSFNLLINHRELLANYIESNTNIHASTIIPIIDKKSSLVQDFITQKLEELGYSRQDALKSSLLIRRIHNSSGQYKDQLMEKITNELKNMIDQIENIEETVMIEKLMASGIDKIGAEKIYKFTSIKGDSNHYFQKIQNLDLPETCLNSFNELIQIKDFLNAHDVLSHVIFDNSLARGLDYYTGIVFEAFDATGQIVRAILGGGRYDDLVTSIGGSPLTGVGFGMGDLVVKELMEINNLFRDIEKNSVGIYIAPIKATSIPASIQLATRLRSKFKLLVNPFDWKLSRHFEFADLNNAKLCILIGPKDIENNVISLRNMSDSSQHQIKIDKDLEQNIGQYL